MSLPDPPAGERAALRHISPGDEAEFVKNAADSVSLHHPWMTMPVSPDEFATMMKRYSERNGAGLPVNLGLLVCDRADGHIAGVVNVSNVVYGRFLSATLGYCAFAASAGHGYLTEGLNLVIKYAFTALDLHRLEANIQPGNEASRRLVQRTGFRCEGLSPDYLFIDGGWRDHQRWAITREMTPYAQ